MLLFLCLRVSVYMKLQSLIFKQNLFCRSSTQRKQIQTKLGSQTGYMKQSNSGRVILMRLYMDPKFYGGMSYIVLRTNIIIKCLDCPVN